MPDKPEYDLADLAAQNFLRQITQPSSDTDRRRILSQAQSGNYPKTDCPHPVTAIDGVEDYGPAARSGRPLNMFICSLCGSHLFLVDPYGKWAADAP